MTLEALSLMEKAEPVQVHFRLLLGINGVCECKMDVKSTWIPTWHRMGSCFMVTWTVLKKPPLGGRPNTKPGDHAMALRRRI
jgi:hypothetical protein